jgi:predicted nucleic acid-binding protein
MQKIIISDTSCLILLEKIRELELLHQLFGTITTTNEVALEFGHPLPNWFEIKQPLDSAYQKIIETNVDRGEASAIALAVEQDDCLLIIDELKGRKFAKQLGLKIIGTIGIFVQAKRLGIIPSIKPILSKMRQTNFRISTQLEETVLKLSGEI